MAVRGDLAGPARPVHAEDLVVGREYPLGSYPVAAAEALDFATQWDPQYFHIDEEAAHGGYFGGLIVSGIHTIAIFSRLLALAHLQHWNIIAGKGFRDLRFPAPVRAGDTLGGALTIEDVTFRGQRPALVSAAGSLRNQNGREVLWMSSVFVVHTRLSAQA